MVYDLGNGWKMTVRGKSATVTRREVHQQKMEECLSARVVKVLDKLT